MLLQMEAGALTNFDEIHVGCSFCVSKIQHEYLMPTIAVNELNS